MLDSSTTYDGPSGTRYTVYLERAFEVTNEQDIEFFRSKPNRFAEETLKEAIESTSIDKPIEENKKDKPRMSEDTKLEIELKKIKGLPKNSIKLVMDNYLSIADLKKTIKKGFRLNYRIPLKHKKLIKEYFMNEKGDE